MRTEYSFDSPATPSQVFQHVGFGLFKNHSLWDPTVVAMSRHEDGPLQVGSTGEETRAFGGRKMSNEIRITIFDPNRQFGFEATSGPVREHVICTIAPLGTGSRVTLALSFTSFGPMRVLWPIMSRIIARNVRRNRERFQRAVNSAATEHALGSG